MDQQESSHPPTKADLDEAKDLDRRLTEAVSRKDIDAAMACFWDNPDLVMLFRGQVYRGTDAVRASFEELFDQNESIRLEVNEITHLPSGDGLIGVGTATYELKPEGGPRKLMVERWSDLRRKINGRWVYVLDHTTEIPEK